jgi:ACR3 family arsenite transporter
MAMAGGVALGRFFPTLGAVLDSYRVGDISLPIALGLLWMMYPVLAKVKYDRLGKLKTKGSLFATSLVLNWIVGPLLMFVLAYLFLPDMPHYRAGLILIGLARCVAMVLIWNSLACGSGEIAAVLVALNSVFQVFTYSIMGWFFLSIAPQWLGETGTDFHVSIWLIAKSVLVFLGVPLVAGALTRVSLVRIKGESWYENQFIRRIGPTALMGLLYTIVIIFAMQGDKLTSLPMDILRISLPLIAYFVLMFVGAFWLGWKLRFSYEETASLAFTAAGNNFELAIAVSIAVFGVTSPEALAGIVGPLIEVPMLLTLVYLALWLKDRAFSPNGAGQSLAEVKLQ